MGLDVFSKSSYINVTRKVPIYTCVYLIGSRCSRSSMVFGSTGGWMYLAKVVGLSVVKVAKCILPERHKFTLVFDFSVAEVAGFSGVRRV